MIIFAKSMETMDFSTSEQQTMITQMIRDFGESNIRPHLLDWDEKQEFPRETLSKLGDLGLMGVLVPEDLGGAGLGYFEYVTAIVEIAKFCGGLGLSVAAHNSLCTGHILGHGNSESDALRMKCTAIKDGKNWVLNGAKNWITHGISGDIAVVLARTGELLDSDGITAFVLEKGMPGFRGGKKENKLGMRCSETAELIMEDCIVPEDNILGKPGQGFRQAMQVLDGGRISIAALSIGIAKGAYEAALKYSKEREQFGQPISNFQGIAFKLADMATEIEAAELLTFRAAELKNKGQAVTRNSAMAKYYASEVAVKTSVDAVQIFGGYGYTKEFPVEKFYRDSKLCTIGEGTSEIQKLVIARQILK
jgi:alkylation response protein AidB-like acyl-CoA dehydrogenase